MQVFSKSVLAVPEIKQADINTETSPLSIRSMAFIKTMYIHVASSSSIIRDSLDHFDSANILTYYFLNIMFNIVPTYTSASKWHFRFSDSMQFSFPVFPAIVIVPHLNTQTTFGEEYKL
jgi:hypothetical protein